MKIRGQLEWQDYLKAQLLHSKQSKAIRFLIYGFVILWVAAYLSILFVGTFREKYGIYLPLGLVAIGAVVFIRYVYTPNRVKKIFNQQKDLQAPFEMEITETRLNVSNEFGTSNRLWSDFPNWKEDDELFLLYHSDVMYSIIPKRVLSNKEIELTHSYITENIQRVKQRSRFGCVIWVIILFILVLFFLIVNFQQQAQNF